jgi:hypothetical protein
MHGRLQKKTAAHDLFCKQAAGPRSVACSTRSRGRSDLILRPPPWRHATTPSCLLGRSAPIAIHARSRPHEIDRMARSGGTVECAPDDRSNGEPGRPRQARIAFALLAAVWKEIDHQVPSLSRVRVRSGSVFIPPIWTLIQYSPVTVHTFLITFHSNTPLFQHLALASC